MAQDGINLRVQETVNPVCIRDRYGNIWSRCRTFLEVGYFYAPYLPWNIIDRTDIWEDDGGQ
jgi:hypothetical protein